MHELSIAYSLVETAQEAARAAQAPSVSVVHLRIGALSGVDTRALLFGYDIAASGTLLEGSTLAVEELPVVIYCKNCDRLTTLEGVQAFRCTLCGTPSAEIRQGRELEIVSLEVPDDAEDR